MQFQILKHVVTRYFDTKSLKKINKYDDSLDCLYKCKFVFWQKEKKRIGEYTGNLTFLFCDNFGKKRKVSAIPKSPQK